MTRLAFPYQIGRDGRSAGDEYDDHVRGLIEQVLFTAPGERVNRPTFGSGLLAAVFQPNSDELAATLHYLAQTSLQQCLGDLIDLEGLQITTRDSTLNVTVRYVVKRTAQRAEAQFARTV
jgi:phage baseplate assembly protein W